LEHSAELWVGRIADHQPGAEFADHGGVIASVGKFLAQGGVQVDAAADRIDCLPSHDPLGKAVMA
jgi:hypothetical protein